MRRTHLLSEADLEARRRERERRLSPGDQDAEARHRGALRRSADPDEVAHTIHQQISKEILPHIERFRTARREHSIEGGPERLEKLRHAAGAMHKKLRELQVEHGRRGTYSRADIAAHFPPPSSDREQEHRRHAMDMAAATAYDGVLPNLDLHKDEAQKIIHHIRQHHPQSRISMIHHDDWNNREAYRAQNTRRGIEWVEAKSSNPGVHNKDEHGNSWHTDHDDRKEESLARTPLLVEHIIRPVRHLQCFDLDGTLLLSPEPHWGKEHYRYHTRSYTHPRGRNWDDDHGSDWWGNPKSLTGTEHAPFKIRPIKNTLKAYHAAKADPHGHVVIMTGRVNRPEMRQAVSASLRKIGIKNHQHGHNLFLKPPNEKGKEQKTEHWKAEMLRQFHKQHPHLEKVHMWDDRAEHLDHFAKTLHELGVKHELHHVKDPRWSGDMPSHA